MNNNLPQILQALKSGTDNIAHDLCSKRGYKTPYVIRFQNLDDYDPPSDIIISAGNPVNITMSATFVAWCLMFEKKYLFRHKLESALEHMHLVHRTLKHPIPLSKAIALRKEARTWVKAIAPFIPKSINESHLKIEYSVTVKDVVSEIEITLHGKDPIELRKIAIDRLSNQVYENEDYEEMHEKLKEIMQAKEKKILPSVIVIDDSTQSVNIKVGY